MFCVHFCHSICVTPPKAINNQIQFFVKIKDHKKHPIFKGMADSRYIFTVEWFDTSASLVRTYYLTYFTLDKTIEMVKLNLNSPTFYDEQNIYL